MSLSERNRTDLTYTYLFETINDRIRLLKQLLDVDETFHLLLGNNYMELSQYDQAVAEYEKSMEVYKRIGVPLWVLDYTLLANAYLKTGQYIKAEKLLKKADRKFPGTPSIIRRQATISLIEGDTIKANKYITKFVSILRENSTSEAAIEGSVGLVYSEAGMFDQAERYYYKALSLQPDSTKDYNAMAWFLIENNRDLNKGLDLVDKALERNPDDRNFHDTKGWALYKLGRYEEALPLIEKSWEMRDIYDHELYTHLQEVKKAVAARK